MKLRFRIDAIPPSYNKHFKIAYNFRHVYLTQEAKLFKLKVKTCMPTVSGITQANLFAIRIEVHQNWYYKNGKVKKHDIQNLDKLLIDAVFEQLGVDDSKLFEVTLKKIQNSSNSFTMVEVCIINEGISLE